jgi:hypothetical protein
MSPLSRTCHISQSCCSLHVGVLLVKLNPEFVLRLQCEDNYHTLSPFSMSHKNPQDLTHEDTVSLLSGSPKTQCSATRISWWPVLLEKKGQRYSPNRTGSQKVVSEWSILHQCESGGLRIRQVMALLGLPFSADQTCYFERSRNHFDVASSIPTNARSISPSCTPRRFPCTKFSLTLRPMS